MPKSHTSNLQLSSDFRKIEIIRSYVEVFTRNNVAFSESIIRSISISIGLDEEILKVIIHDLKGGVND